METIWHDAATWGVEGKGWQNTTAYYDRLPSHAQGLVREPVWNLSRQSAGMLVRFETDATAIYARWTLGSPELARPHFSASGVSGLDLYGLDSGGDWRWVGATRPTTFPTVEASLIDGMEREARTFMLYLPLFNPVVSLEIGVPTDASFRGVPPRTERPIAYYGTSIVHGASASRPGMTHAAILGRRLDTPILNLGFSGNGKMEPEVARLLAELDPSVYVIDCLPNMTGDLVRERAAPLVRILRTARPQTPIVLVEDRTYPRGHWLASQRTRNSESRAALREAYNQLIEEGCGKLSYVEGDPLLGDDGEATVDGSHPTDLGFVRMADALLPALRTALTQGANPS